jgi:hypothetical protein
VAKKNLLLIVLLAYAAASLLHLAHNAEFLDEYPNMPVWLSPAGVYAAWLGVTAVGLAGYFLIRRGHETAGLAVLIVYGALGLDSIAHYALAPLSAHAPMMNITIGLEVAAAVLLLATVASLMFGRLRRGKAP